MKKKILLLISSIALVIIVLTTTTYALYFNKDKLANSEDYTTGYIDIVLENDESGLGNTLTLSNAVPLSDSEGASSTPYRFKITNNGNLDYEFDLTLTRSGTINGSYVKVKVDAGNPITLTNATNTVATGLKLYAGASMIVNVRVWLDENTPNSEMNKTMSATLGASGQAKERLGLIEMMRSEAVMDNIASTYVTSSTGINFNYSSSDTNGKGLYIRSGTENDTYPIVYYRGDVDNNLIFANYCWKAVRTTEENGLKLLYNGEPYNIYESEEKISQSGYTNIVNNRYTFDSTNKKWSAEADDELLTMSFSVSEAGNYVLEFSLDGALDCPVDGCGRLYSFLKLYKNNVPIGYSSGYYDKVENGRIVLENLTTSDVIEVRLFSKDELELVNVDFSMIKVTGDIIEKSCDNNGVLAQLETLTTYNSSSASTAYVGYMYGTAGASTYEETHANINDSLIKQHIDEWYENNMTSYTNKLEKVVFCNDRSLYSGTGIGSPTSYGLWGRLYSSINITPTLDCPNENNDLFSTSDASKGNKALTYPVGLFTADEWIMAGSSDGYLSNSYFWTGTPFNDYNIYVSFGPAVFGNGYSAEGIRPVISLASGFKIEDGDGTVNNPYIVSD